MRLNSDLKLLQNIWFLENQNGYFNFQFTSRNSSPI